MRRILAALGIGAALAAPAAAQDGLYGKYETPRYTVENVVGGAEVRLYQPHVLAIVSVQGDQRGALGAGFRVLAQYIFGGNQTSDKVAMTSPVTQTQTATQGAWTVTFMMPQAYTIDSLPQPNNPAVRFMQADAERRVVLVFSGRANRAALDRKTQELREIVRQNGLTVRGDPIFAFYDDPFTAPWRRRNEVAFVVE